MNLAWSEFRTLVQRWKSRPHNALAESLAGHSVWTVGEQLTALLLDATNMQTYVIQRVNGNKSARRPKPIPRPWDEKPPTFGSGPIPLDQVDAWIHSTYDDDVAQVDAWMDSREEG